jgi:hypothetical protein
MTLKNQRAAILALLVATAFASPALATQAWTVGPAFSVNVSLTPKAAARLAHPKDTIRVWAEFVGEMNGKHAKLGDQMGQVRLSKDRTIELPAAGVARFPGPRYDANLLPALDADGFQVLINVQSGNHSTKDNFLDCGLFQDKLEVAARAPIQISCKLVGE